MYIDEAIKTAIEEKRHIVRNSLRIEENYTTIEPLKNTDSCLGVITKGIFMDVFKPSLDDLIADDWIVVKKWRKTYT